MAVKVEYQGKRKFKAKVRGHEFVIDLPAANKGDDSGPTPPEVFIASLGSCMGVFAASYLEVAGFDPSGLSLALDWDYSGDKKRIDRIRVEAKVKGTALGDKAKGLLASMEKCTIHQTLHNAPGIETVITQE